VWVSPLLLKALQSLWVLIRKEDGFFLRAESFYNVASNIDEIKSVNYKETEHYIVTKQFMDAPEKIIEELLG